MEFSTICRVCMQPISLEYIDLDTPFNETTYFECFNYCTKLEAKASDKFPKTICLSCANLLQMSYDFINAAAEADRLFHECFAQLDGNADIKFIDEEDEILSKEVMVLQSNSDKNKTDIKPTIYNELIIDVDDCQKYDSTQYHPIKITDTALSLIEQTDVSNKNDFPAFEILESLDIEELEDTIKVKGNTKSKPQAQNDNKVYRYILPKESSQPNINGDLTKIVAFEKNTNLDSIDPKEKLEGKLVVEQVIDAAKDLFKNSKQNIKTAIKCRICNKKITKNYADHMNQHTGKKPYKCNKCEGSFLTLQKFQLHKAQIHKKFRYAWFCKKCGEGFENEAQLSTHLENYHDSNKTCGLCLTCGDCFVNQELLEWHVKKEHWSRKCPVECPHCKKKYQLNTLPKHVEYAHFDIFYASKNKDYPCEFCFQILNSPSELEEHITIHKGKNNYTCATCGKDFKGKRVFKEHKETMHQITHITPTIRKCNKCDFTTNNLSLLVKHRKKHYNYHQDRTPKFLCAYCPKKFFHEKPLHDHEDYKHGEQKSAHPCDMCDKKFYSQYKLKAHKKSRHANDRPFMCKECPKAFKLKPQLLQHERNHYGKKYDCPHCDKKFVQPCYLRVHMRTHTNELPFECHLCDKKFAIKVRLTYHLAKHEGIVRKCEHCPAVFESMAKLRIHRFVHIGYPYVCDECKENHHKKESFIRHMRRHHGKIMTPELVEENRLRNMKNFYRRNTTQDKLEPEL